MFFFFFFFPFRGNRAMLLHYGNYKIGIRIVNVMCTAAIKRLSFIFERFFTWLFFKNICPSIDAWVYCFCFCMCSVHWTEQHYYFLLLFFLLPFCISLILLCECICSLKSIWFIFFSLSVALLLERLSISDETSWNKIYVKREREIYIYK